MLNNEIKDFLYHEFKTDSDNLVKDMTKLFSLGCYSDEVKDANGNIIKPSNASIEYNWHIVYPNADLTLINREVKSIEELDSKEYEIVTLDQLKRITDHAVVKCKTLSTDRGLGKSVIIGETQEEYAELFLELYMPKYLCDTETEDPTMQMDGYTIPKCVNPKTGVKDAIIRNYHWMLMRLFDNPKEDFSGPVQNIIDPVTGELMEFNSASSEWTKLSWFTDFEEKFYSELPDMHVDDENDRVIRVPVNASLTNKTKIRVMANAHPNRFTITVVGNPNVDYGDNRYLISNAYIGAIDSFKNSKRDTEGNFGIYTSSSTTPCVPKTIIDFTSPFDGLTSSDDEAWKKYDNHKYPKLDLSEYDDEIKGWVSLGGINNLNLKNVNSKDIYEGMVEFELPYKKREIPKNSKEKWSGGRTTVVDKDLKVGFGKQDGKKLALNFIYEYGDQAVGHPNNQRINVSIPMSDSKTTTLPVHASNVNVHKPADEFTEYIKVKVIYDDLYKYLMKYIKTEVSDSKNAVIPGAYETQIIELVGLDMFIGFKEQGEVKKVVGGASRDSYGNLIKMEYHSTFGIHTANGTTDFAMYKTDSADFFQSHFLMFSSTEQFMKKHMYGKSVYTNEYFADRIKVTHSAEGVRGVLSGLIIIDADSLFPFDELIVNKDFSKDKDKPEETYIYLPITAPFCPFANSPNERYGLGLLKGLKHNEHDDEAKCEAALMKLADQYKDSYYYTNNKEEIILADKTHNGLSIEWSVSDSSIVTLPNAEK